MTMAKKKTAKKVAAPVATKTALVNPAQKTEHNGEIAPMMEKKPEPVIDSCETCRFCKDSGMKTITCRRYPSPPGVVGQASMLRNDWCGEFKAK